MAGRFSRALRVVRPLPQFLSLVFPSSFLLFSFRPPSRNASVNRRRRRTNIYLALITVLFFLSWEEYTNSSKNEWIGP